MDPLALTALGFVLGLRHAADSDHVVAVTAIASRERRVGPAALVGAVWGLGRTLTLFLVGGGIIVFNLAVPPRLALGLEFIVGIALAAVGLMNVLGRGGFADAGAPRVTSLRAFAVGIVHGLAGSSAVALMVLATVRDPLVGLAYLAVFGLGTMVGMVLVTLGMASPVAIASRRFAWSGERLRLATGLLSLGFGAWLMVHIGWADGLFRAGVR